MNRPERRNALSTELVRALVAAFEGVSASTTVGAVVLTGAGDFFCSGADLNPALAAAGPLAMHEDRMDQRAYHQLRNSAANDRVKRCGIRLFGSSKASLPWMRRVCHHQALLQIYQDFCLEDFSGCHECPFPEQLAQWR
jgi:hypothetical protein